MNERESLAIFFNPATVAVISTLIAMDRFASGAPTMGWIFAGAAGVNCLMGAYKEHKRLFPPTEPKNTRISTSADEDLMRMGGPGADQPS